MHCAIRTAFAAVLTTAATVSSAFAADLDFGGLFANVTDNVIVVETAPDDVLVFGGGVFTLDGRQLIIRAPSVRIDAPTVIRSFAPASAPLPIDGTPQVAPQGARGNTWGCRDVEIRIFGARLTRQVCERDGQTGNVGTVGAGGSTGAPANSIELSVGATSGTSSLYVIANGQRGGKGQQGGKGGPGGGGIDGANRGGDAFCRGQNRQLNGSRGGNGGQGGPGGQGGVGGAAGTIVANVGTDTPVVAIDESQFASANYDAPWDAVPPAPATILLAVPGGLGGDGGNPGIGGDGVPGGSGGGRSHCGGGGDPGAAGQPGPDGAAGPVGPSAPWGVITINRPAAQ